MKILDTPILPSNFNLYQIGDSHEGTILQHREGLLETIEAIHDDPIGYAVHMGDEIEAITIDDPRYDMETQERSTPLQQRDNVVKDFAPIAEKTLVWLWGNHPQKLAKFGNITLDICTQLGIEYGTWTAKLKFHDTHGPMFKAFLTHGIRGRIVSNAKDYEQQQANMKASLKRKLEAKAGDCLLMSMGHTHLLLIVEPAKRLYLTDDGDSVKQRYLTPGSNEDYIAPDRRWYTNTGSFLKLYGNGVSGYAEIAGYDPVELGYILVKVRDRKIQSVEKVTV